MSAEIPEIPEGYRIERVEGEGIILGRAEVCFAVYARGVSEPVAMVRARDDRQWGEWAISPGPSTRRVDAGEARARAVALIMAADEADRQNESRRIG